MTADRNKGIARRAPNGFPNTLSMHERSEIIARMLKRRMDKLLPRLMREEGYDMWLILCQEDNLDPVFTTLVPMDTWCPILQMLVFYDRGVTGDLERINISGTATHDFYDRPYTDQIENEQWSILRQLLEDRDPKRIGINIGSVQWAAGGLTHNLYEQLTRNIPSRYTERLVSSEPLVVRLLATLTDEEQSVYEHVVEVAHAVIAECYDPSAIEPGVTALQDLQWHYRQRCSELAVETAFNPSFTIQRHRESQASTHDEHGTIQPGDLIHCDVGIRYLRLNTDHQQLAYVLRAGESDAPQGLKRLMDECTLLQDIFMESFARGLTGNELLRKILTKARSQGISNPRVFSHSLGLFLHETGPLIGLPWEQESCPGRGDVELDHGNGFAMELSVSGPVNEWKGQQVLIGREEDMVFTEEGSRIVHGRQTSLYLI